MKAMKVINGMVVTLPVLSHRFHHHLFHHVQGFFVGFCGWAAGRPYQRELTHQRGLRDEVGL